MAFSSSSDDETQGTSWSVVLKGDKRRSRKLYQAVTPIRIRQTNPGSNHAGLTRNDDQEQPGSGIQGEHDDDLIMDLDWLNLKAWTHSKLNAKNSF